MSLPQVSRQGDNRPCRFLTALPVFNEVGHVTEVLDEVVKYAADVLVVDDGSTDGTRELLSQRSDVKVLLHDKNLGYGGALKTAFDYALAHHYELVVTIDCDGQHEPQRICDLAAACRHFDIASGSRYLEAPASTEQVPSDRLSINRTITNELNERLGLNLTDAFCGFKAYRTTALAKLKLSETGYAMPLELWVQAAWHALRIAEVSVPLIYLDEKRSFGGALDAADLRLKYYREVIDRAVAACGPVPPVSTGTSAPELCCQPCV
ncbi:MAG: glycosyltransferase family 2 protein [Bythopirellula sp.]|nr:glycosyltransferase family 2 protein [Bythopirellula sp.]